MEIIAQPSDRYVLSAKLSKTSFDHLYTDHSVLRDGLLERSFSYTFQIKDNGPWSVDDVAFGDPLPSQVSFVGVSTSNGSQCSQVTGTVSCDLGPVNVGQQVNVVITVLAPTAPSSFTNTVSITPSVTDTQPSNNSVGVTVQVK